MNVHVIGNPGSGKTTYLINHALREIDGNNGVVFIDHNGSAIDTILRHFPKRRTSDVLIIDPSDFDRPVGCNVLGDTKRLEQPGKAKLIRDTIKALANYTGATPVMNRMLFNTIAALLFAPGSTLLSMEPMLTDSAYRASILKHVDDPYLRYKWAYWGKKLRKDWEPLISSTENKAGDFSEDPRIRNILGQKASTFDLRALLFEGKVILLRLPQAQLGLDTAAMFASLFLAQIKAVAYAQGIQVPTTVFIDDFHTIAEPLLCDLLTSARRHNLNLMLSNSYLGQLSDTLRSSVIGNCATRVMFRLGHDDSKELHETIPQSNNVPKLHELGPFDTLTYEGGELHNVDAPKPKGRGSTLIARGIVDQSRRTYGVKREVVEAEIAAFYEGLGDR